MKPIDITKPLELSDGTPATYSTRYSSFAAKPAIWATPEGDRCPSAFDPVTGRGLGKYEFRAVYLRNVGEAAPALDLTKPLQRKDGLRAHVVATGVTSSIPGVDAWRSGDEDLLVSVEFPERDELFYYFSNGRYVEEEETDRDLINVPEEAPAAAPEVAPLYVNAYPTDSTNFMDREVYTYADRDKADRAAARAYHPALLKVELVDGKLVVSKR